MATTKRGDINRLQHDQVLDEVKRLCREFNMEVIEPVRMEGFNCMVRIHQIGEQIKLKLFTTTILEYGNVLVYPTVRRAGHQDRSDPEFAFWSVWKSDDIQLMPLAYIGEGGKTTIGWFVGHYHFGGKRFDVPGTPLRTHLQILKEHSGLGDE